MNDQKCNVSRWVWKHRNLGLPPTTLQKTIASQNDRYQYHRKNLDTADKLKYLALASSVNSNLASEKGGLGVVYVH